MPFITIDSNSKVQVSDEMLEDLVALVSQELKKPTAYIVAEINSGRRMAYDGVSSNLGALVTLRSIGFNCDRPALVKKLTSFCEVNLGVEAQFVNIDLINMNAADVAAGGNLFG